MTSTQQHPANRIAETMHGIRTGRLTVEQGREVFAAIKVEIGQSAFTLAQVAAIAAIAADSRTNVNA